MTAVPARPVIRLVVPVVVLGIVVALALAFGGGAVPAQSQDSGGAAESVTVQGVGTVTARPDLLRLGLGVEGRGATVDDALARANQAMRDVQAVLTEAGSTAATCRPVGCRSGLTTTGRDDGSRATPSPRT